MILPGGPEADETLYSRLGGADPVAVVVDQCTMRMLGGERINGLQLCVVRNGNLRSRFSLGGLPENIGILL